MPVHTAVICRWDGKGWKVKSKVGGKKDQIELVNQVLTQYVKHKVHKKSMRLRKVHFLVNKDDNCFLALTNDEYDVELIWMMLNKLNRECSDTNKKYLKETLTYWNKTDPELVKKANAKLANLQEELAEDSDDEEEGERKDEEDDIFAGINLKKDMKRIEKHGRSAKKCSLM